MSSPVPATLATASHAELLVRKSRFIACVQPMTDRAGALAQVTALRTVHPGAAHVCWALMAGGHSAAVDDGEPSGTAGRPMLAVLRHQRLDSTLATVVRYFGGVKLGAGGLVRAYTDAVVRALAGADRVSLVRRDTASCTVPFETQDAVRRALQQAGADLLDAQPHGADITLHWQAPIGATQAVRLAIDAATRGRAVWERGLPVPPPT